MKTKAMAFYHEDGLVPAYKMAALFASKEGRLATLPDVVAARLATKPGQLPWETYFTTTSAEYYGIGQSGQRLLIVAHGIGPMSTLDGAQKAYSWQYKDKSRERHGGRISQQEFLSLEAGEYGPVHIIDLDSYCQRYEYPFIQQLRVSEALTDPVLHARLGGREQAELYVHAHAEHARAWHRHQAGVDPENRYLLPNYQDYLMRRHKLHYANGASNSDPYILQVDDASNLCYFFGWEHGFRPIEEGMAMGHLLSTGRLSHMHHEGNESLVLDYGCHGWHDGVRMLALRPGASAADPIDEGMGCVGELVRRFWEKLIQPVEQPNPVGFRALMQVGTTKQWFTQHEKQGERTDTHQPEFRVTKIQQVGEPTIFRTTHGGGFFFKYGINEVERLVPQGANAYILGEPYRDGEMFAATVHFCHIEVDNTKCVPRSESLKGNLKLLLGLLSQSEAD